jgi:hypothetical protein
VRVTDIAVAGEIKNNVFLEKVKKATKLWLHFFFKKKNAHPCKWCDKDKIFISQYSSLLIEILKF